MESYEQIMNCFGLSFGEIHKDTAIHGSPERVEKRAVVSSKAGKLYLAEQIRQRDLQKKEKIAESLDFLFSRGLAVSPYLRNSDGRFIASVSGELWMLSAFIKGVALKRPSYALESWRGKALANFLISLNKAIKGTNIVSFIDSKVFSIEDYIKENFLHNKSFIYNRSYERAFKIAASLAGLFESCSSIKPAYCHGDFHPINVIWGNNKINAVIDWEFAGLKPELYDAANLIGCVGIDTTNAFFEGLVPAFVAKLRNSSLFSGKSWELLIELIIALRFGWLSEWLRRNNNEMIDTELCYMELLAEKKESLRKLFLSIS